MHVRREGVTTSRVGDDVMLLDLESSTYYAIGGSGVLVLEALRAPDGVASVDELVDGVLAEHPDAARDTVQQGVQRFLEQLRQVGLLQG
ncbi:PqqD family protein [Jannaschia sp. R86511]|uniref:PqqD family protein n=1 Tax=Jannaschia sp. R86511 TaxID=3093853 RepID=UPI0036D22D63